MDKIKAALKQANGNAKEAFYILCKEQGIDPNIASTNLLQRVAGIPNIDTLITNALSSSPQLKELASLLK